MKAGAFVFGVPKRWARRLALGLQVLLVGFGVLVVTAPSFAHHILGIPHYAYDEEYPQTPVLTYRVEAGRYEIRMTGYPGELEPGDQCSLHVYVRSVDTGELFDGDMMVTVTRDTLFGTDPIVYGPVTGGLEESVYKFYPRFETVDHFTARIEFYEDGTPWILEIPMVVGEPGSPKTVLVGSIGALIAFLIVVRAIRIKRRRRGVTGQSPSGLELTA